ncbi:uncharacterized protein [Typha latifolia]|uniref:uncharacterized protein n=1 Tax=Typha latifolia TaxID=4733 RepID=UPI003C2B14E6
MGDEGGGEKKRGRDGCGEEELRRVAEIVMVLSTMADMRGGKEPTAAEKAMVAEARERLAGVCEGVKPKDLFSREAVRVVVEDLGLNRMKDSAMGFRPPKMSIAEKVLLTKKKMEETKEIAMHQSFSPSQHLPVALGTNPDHQGKMLPGAPRFMSEKASAMSISSGGLQSQPMAHVPALASAATSLKQPQINDTRSSLPVKPVSNPSLALPHREAHARLNGPTYLSQTGGSSALAAHEQTSKLLDHNAIKSEGMHEINAVQASNQVMGNQEAKASLSQAGSGSLLIGHQAPPGITFVHTPSVFTNHSDIAKNVQRILQPKVSNYPNWIPPSTEYMNKLINCQVCKIIVTDVESLLVCDACEKGTHLKCLPSSDGKVIPKSEWHCQKCLTSSNGRPLPPKYGKVTRTVGAPKAASNTVAPRASAEKRPENPDSKRSYTVASVSRATNTGGNHVELSESSNATVVEGQESSFSEMKREDGVSAETSSSHLTEDGMICNSTGKQNESSEKNLQNCGVPLFDKSSFSESMLAPAVVSENITPEQSCGDGMGKSQDTQELSVPQIDKNVNTESSLEASGNQMNNIRKKSIDELRESFSGQEASKHTGDVTRLDDGDEHRAISNGALDCKDEAKDCSRPSLSDLNTVDWVGDAVKVVDGRTYYKSCHINHILYKLQDHVLIASEGRKFIPSKLRSLWEDNESASKWADVSPYYLPTDLPQAVSQPSGTEDSEVYALSNQRTIMAASICGPCEVLFIDKFQEESERRKQLVDTNNCLHPIYVCKWKYDESKGILEPVTS